MRSGSARVVGGQGVREGEEKGVVCKIFLFIFGVFSSENWCYMATNTIESSNEGLDDRRLRLLQ